MSSQLHVSIHDFEEKECASNMQLALWGVLHGVASLQDPQDPCPGVTGDITQYLISFEAGSVVATENVNIARCINGRCSYTFKPPSNPPSSYDSVSAAAENVVGRGAVTTCTTQTICKCPAVLPTGWGGKGGNKGSLPWAPSCRVDALLSDTKILIVLVEPSRIPSS